MLLLLTHSGELVLRTELPPDGGRDVGDAIPYECVLFIVVGVARENCEPAGCGHLLVLRQNPHILSGDRHGASPLAMTVLTFGWFVCFGCAVIQAGRRKRASALQGISAISPPGATFSNV